jgi:hypothetical protein
MFSTKSISRLLLNQTPTVNLAERLNEGAIVLVATRKGQAMSEGTRLVMRFLLSMLHRAAESRHSAARHLPIAAYIDEFPDALSKSKTDESLLLLLSQGRKRRLSVVLAHQDFGQVAPSMLTGIASNADLRIIGGVILPVVVNCNGLLDIRRIEKGENKGKPTIDLLALKKGEFVAYRKGGTPRIIVSKKDPLGDMFHRLPTGKKARMKVIEQEMALIHEFMRERYAVPPDNVIHLPDRADDDGFDAAQPVYA